MGNYHIFIGCNNDSNRLAVLVDATAGTCGTSMGLRIRVSGLGFGCVGREVQDLVYVLPSKTMRHFPAYSL